jgi:signal peptidase II
MDANVIARHSDDALHIHGGRFTGIPEDGDIAALGLILGGATGNIIDRWDLGYVIDYADFQIWLGDSMIRPFLIFNIADAAITIGVVIILARSLLVSEKDGDTPNGRPFETGETEQ